MYRLKSIFIVFLNLAAASNSIYALIRLFSKGADLAWAGVAIAGLAVGGYTLNLYRYRTPRTSEQLSGLSLVVAVGVGLSIAGTMLGAADGWRAIIYSSLMLALWLLYVSWYSRLDRDHNDLVVVGKKLPAISVQDEEGNTVKSDSLRANRHYSFFTAATGAPCAWPKSGKRRRHTGN
jgi:hypothetical protein